MSVYSGFATRQLEQQYNKQIVNLIKVLQKRVLKFYRNEHTDEQSFKSVFTQVFQKITQIEENKYFEPYYSEHLLDLCSYLNINANCSQEENSQQIKDLKKPSVNCCNCACHKKYQPENSTFLTSYNMSQNRFHQKSQNISQDDLKKSDREKSSHSKTNRPQYIDSSRNTTRRAHAQNNNKIINRKLDNSTDGVLRLTNKSFQDQKKQLNQVSQQEQFRNFSSSRTPKTAGQSKRSPYYSIIYPFQGQTYNKVSVERRNSHSNNKSSKSPANTGNLKTHSIRAPYMSENLIQVQKPTLSTPNRTQQIVRTLAPTIPIIKEVSAQNEGESIKVNFQQIVESDNAQQQIQEEQLSRKIDFDIKIEEEQINIPNPNESNEQTIEKNEKTI